MRTFASRGMLKGIEAECDELAAAPTSPIAAPT
jgi:hypothetical protein